MNVGIETVRQLGARYSNWGRWGNVDQLGTLNFRSNDAVVRAAHLVKTGRAVSLAIPFDRNGPQVGNGLQFNPVLLVTRDGSDVIAEEPGIREHRRAAASPYLRSADDVVIMPLQCGTQWDTLSHIMFEKQMYNGFNGFGAGLDDSGGARVLDIGVTSNRMVGRGVLLDLPLERGVEYLPSGYVITGDDLEDAYGTLGGAVEAGDFLLVRTGQLAEVRQRGWWGD